MMDHLDDALWVGASLDRAGVDYVLVGSVALAMHSLVRATEDLYICVRSDESNIEKLRQALRMAWDDSAIEEISANRVREEA